MQLTADDILTYWFSERIARHWFNSTPDIDREIKDRFETIWTLASQGELDDWLDSATGCLVLIILLDQMPLNMFRGQAKSFSTEARAVSIAKQAIQQAFDKQLPKEQLIFMYMPFMHSENMQDQNMAVELFRQAGLQENLKFAQHHLSIVERFGRFPHRNKILGRQSSQHELEYLDSDGAFKG